MFKKIKKLNYLKKLAFHVYFQVNNTNNFVLVKIIMEYFEYKVNFFKLLKHEYYSRFSFVINSFDFSTLTLSTRCN